MPFEIYLTDEERRTFQERLSRDPVEVLKSFSRISTRASTCWVINDQNRIHGLIEGSVGFDTMDQVVRDAIAEALKVGGKRENAVITNTKRERYEYSSSEDLAAKIFECDTENAKLKRDILQLKIEISKLHAENLQLRR